MNPTYENIGTWLDTYFEDVNRQQGSIETIPNLRKYFTIDFEFWMYTGRASLKRPLSLDGLLLLFVHPGLHEGLVPQYYVIDVKRMIAVVQFEIRFVDEASGTNWPPRQASAHYHLVIDENNDLRIKKIQYWTETFTPDAFASLYASWDSYREKALLALATNYLKREP
jgi:hypothetical protein